VTSDPAALVYLVADSGSCNQLKEKENPADNIVLPGFPLQK